MKSIQRPIQESYYKGGFVYIPAELSPESHLQDGEPIKLYDTEKSIRYTKQWGRSGKRFFIYNMKDIYESFGGKNSINSIMEMSWSGNILQIRLVTGTVENGRSSDNSKGKEMCQSNTKEYKKGSVIMTVLDRTTFRKEQILLEIMPMPSLYILLKDLSSSSGFYIGHSMNMAQRLNTYYTKPPHGFKWNKALVFVHSDDKPLFVDEAMRLEFLALNKARNIRKNSNRIINRKGAINLNYSEHTEFQTDRMFSDIRKIIDGDLKLNIFS